MAFSGVFAGRRVLVTGHTGFKGSWLLEWLLCLDAEVQGFALDPATEPALFAQAGFAARMRHHVGDVRDFAGLRVVVQDFAPEVVLHLAAQPLVRMSYSQPVETYATNVMGTVNLLEAVRLAGRPCVVVVVTTDKCYENREWLHAYREEDAMGGFDPYSSSKGAAELVVAAYRRSFFGASSGVRVATARAGNVIGGGDWAADRIVPDCVRALSAGRAIPVRNRIATRPWQHVLEPLGGYLWLAACMLKPELVSSSVPLEGAFNFGPNLDSNRTVENLVAEILKTWPGSWVDQSDPGAVHEAGRLNLAIEKAYHALRWEPVWSFERAVAETILWYRQGAGTSGCSAALRAQILSYTHDAERRKLLWTK